MSVEQVRQVGIRESQLTIWNLFCRAQETFGLDSSKNESTEKQVDESPYSASYDDTDGIRSVTIRRTYKGKLDLYKISLDECGAKINLIEDGKLEKSYSTRIEKTQSMLVGLE